MAVRDVMGVIWPWSERFHPFSDGTCYLGTVCIQCVNTWPLSSLRCVVRRACDLDHSFTVYEFRLRLYTWSWSMLPVGTR